MKLSLLFFCCLFPVSLCHAELKFNPSGDSTPFSESVVINGDSLLQTGQIFPDLEKDGSVSSQLESVIQQIKSVLSGAGSSPDQIAKINFYVTDDDTAEFIRQNWSKILPDSKPSACFVTTQLPVEKAKIAVDFLAVTSAEVTDTQVTRKESELKNSGLPLVESSYPSERMVFISGQAENGTLAEATTLTLQSLHDSLKWMKLDASHVVQIKLFMKPMSESGIVYEKIREFYKALGTDTLPAISIVEWKNGLPIEIEMVATYPKDHSFEKAASAQYLTVPEMKASPVFSRVAVTSSDKLIYLSGFYSSPEQNKKGERELRSLYSNLEQGLQKAGSDLDHMIKATYYVSDDVTSQAYTPVRMELYNHERPPAASKASVESVGKSGFTTTIDMIAIPAD